MHGIESENTMYQLLGQALQPKTRPANPHVCCIRRNTTVGPPSIPPINNRSYMCLALKSLLLSQFSAHLVMLSRASNQRSHCRPRRGGMQREVDFQMARLLSTSAFPPNPTLPHVGPGSRPGPGSLTSDLALETGQKALHLFSALCCSAALSSSSI